MNIIHLLEHGISIRTSLLQSKVRTPLHCFTDFLEVLVNKFDTVYFLFTFDQINDIKFLKVCAGT